MTRTTTKTIFNEPRAVMYPTPEEALAHATRIVSVLGPGWTAACWCREAWQPWARLLRGEVSVASVYPLETGYRGEVSYDGGKIMRAVADLPELALEAALSALAAQADLLRREAERANDAVQAARGPREPAPWRCDHDGGYCHHACPSPRASDCRRVASGSSLTTPFDGWPRVTAP